MTAQISLHPRNVTPDIALIDVFVHDLPDRFLGAAFDLNVPEGWHFDHHELCDVFSPDEPDIFHLASPRTDAGGVIFGLAVAGGGYADPRDGCLVRFYFELDRPASGKISFDHTALSIYQNGRRDVSDVQWTDASYDVPLPGIAVQAPVPTQETAGSQLSFGNQVGKTDFFGSLDSSLVDIYVLLLMTLVLAVAVFLVFLAYFRLRPKD